MRVVSGIVAAAVLGAGVAFYFASGRSDSGQERPAGAPTPAAPANPAPQPAAPAVAAKALQPVPTADKTDVPRANWLRFPDGSACPPLNGVQKAPELAWHRLLPYTKVVGVQRLNGLDWYVHENGAMSTTRMVDVDGVPTARCEVRMPAPVMPSDDGKEPK